MESVERLRASLDDDRRPSLLDKGATDEARRRQARQDAVYERFEEAFRGDEAQIRDRVSAYLPDVEFLCALDAPVFDVGCGRGEWLALLEQEGHQAVGVDLNASMVDRCQAAGLTVVHADAIDALAARETGGLGAVTAFHVVEHMRMADLITFLEAAHRGLRPGGVLILETPNPTNLLVGAATFYRDPTHVRPLHPDLLSFLVSEAGFTDVETRFLHPVANDTWSEDPSAFNADLHWALQGPQDYAVVAHVPVA